MSCPKEHNSTKAKNKQYRYVLFGIVMIMIGFIVIKLGLYFTSTVTSLYSYTLKKSSDYQVFLKPNTFYTDEFLPSGNDYAAQSIDYIKMNFQYDFEGKRDIDFIYNGIITANLIGTVKNNENQDKEIWNRTFYLSENKNDTILNKNNFSIQESVNINYAYFNDLARSYEKTYGIAIDAVLKVCFNISYHRNLSDLEMTSEDVQDKIELDIPLTNTVTEVKENYEKTTIQEIQPEVNANEKIYPIIGGSFIIIGLGIIIIIINVKKHPKTSDTRYDTAIKHILKWYKEIIVTITKEPNVTGLHLMELASLEDLIDVAEQNQKNMLYYEVLPHKEGKFYVIVDHFVYVYTIENK